METGYGKPGPGGEQATGGDHGALEAIVREGAQRRRAAALQAEGQTFLGRRRYERRQPLRGYRNGCHSERELTVGVGKVAVRVPRVSALPAETSPEGFQSQRVRTYARAAVATQQLFGPLSLEGLATGDFEPGFREWVGGTTARSANAIVRLKEQWAAAYAAWQRRRLDDHRYAYTWADGISLGAGQAEATRVVRGIIGARDEGEKECLALELGDRERSASWGDLLRDLRDRGLAPPLLASGDGGLGRWAALDQVFPTTQHQRCWHQRGLNVQDKLPKRLHAEARRR